MAAMTGVLHLLGQPHLERNGAAMPVLRGRKAWAILAYVLLTDAAVGRQQVASLLFSEAQDPMRALRWNLVELRRLLGDPDALLGPELKLTLPTDWLIDITIVSSGAWQEALSLPGLGRELLE